MLPCATVPHSFLHYIFLSEESYKKGDIKEEIWQHELTHVVQRHSIDIIITELMQIFLWFNPLLFIYQKMIRVNHEFLADEAVIKSGADARGYQYLLLTPQNSMAGTFPASAFNYAITKKRLLMITKTTSPMKARVKQMMVILPVAGLFLLCCVKTVAQSAATDTVPKVNTRYEAPSGTEGVSDEVLAEYLALSKKVEADRKQGQFVVSEEDRLSLIHI